MSRHRFLAALSWSLALSSCTADGTSGPSAAVRVVEAGWSFGFCLGPCRAELSISGSELAYRVTSRGGDEVFASNRGLLTARGSTRLDALASALPEGLRETYGCPDCADGGAAFVTVLRDGAARRVEYEYRTPPAELAALDGFLAPVMEALGQCRSTPDATVEGTCTPLPE